MKKVKVALIGYGHLGKWHAQKAQQLAGAELVAIVEPFEAARKIAKANHENVKVVSSLNEVLAEIEAALVVTPTSFHFEVVKDLLLNNKHVFCEKPLTSTYSQALEVKKLLADKALVLQVGHSERCHQIWEKLEDFNFAFNKAKVVTIQRTSPFKGRAADVGVVEDLMIHDIDLMRMLFGDPKSVRAYGAKLITENYDHVKAMFFYSDKVVTIENSRVDVKVERSIEAISNDGVVKIDLFTNKIIYSKNLTSKEDQVITEESYEKRDHLLVEQEKFYNSITNGADIFVDIDAGVDAIKIIEAVNSSLKSGREAEI